MKNKYERNRKLDKIVEGLFEILQVNDNGPLTIHRGGYSETIHIHRLKPYGIIICIEKQKKHNK